MSRATPAGGTPAALNPSVLRSPAADIPASSLTRLFPARSVFSAAQQGPKAYQEDSLFTWSSPSGKVTVAAVFDGHGGRCGAIASSAAAATALAWLGTRASSCESWGSATWRVLLTELFGACHASVRLSLKEDGVRIGDVLTDPPGVPVRPERPAAADTTVITAADEAEASASPAVVEYCECADAAAACPCACCAALAAAPAKDAPSVPAPAPLLSMFASPAAALAAAADDGAAHGLATSSSSSRGSSRNSHAVPVASGAAGARAQFFATPSLSPGHRDAAAAAPTDSARSNASSGQGASRFAEWPCPFTAGAGKDGDVQLGPRPAFLPKLSASVPATAAGAAEGFAPAMGPASPPVVTHTTLASPNTNAATASSLLPPAAVGGYASPKRSASSMASESRAPTPLLALTGAGAAGVNTFSSSSSSSSYNEAASAGADVTLLPAPAKALRASNGFLPAASKRASLDVAVIAAANRATPCSPPLHHASSAGAVMCSPMGLDAAAPAAADADEAEEDAQDGEARGKIRRVSTRPGAGESAGDAEAALCDSGSSDSDDDVFQHRHQHQHRTQNHTRGRRSSVVSNGSCTSNGTSSSASTSAGASATGSSAGSAGAVPPRPAPVLSPFFPQAIARAGGASPAVRTPAAASSGAGTPAFTRTLTMLEPSPVSAPGDAEAGALLQSPLTRRKTHGDEDEEDEQPAQTMAPAPTDLGMRTPPRLVTPPPMGGSAAGLVARSPVLESATGRTVLGSHQQDLVENSYDAAAGAGAGGHVAGPRTPSVIVPTRAVLRLLDEDSAGAGEGDAAEFAPLPAGWLLNRDSAGAADASASSGEFGRRMFSPQPGHGATGPAPDSLPRRRRSPTLGSSALQALLASEQDAEARAAAAAPAATFSAPQPLPVSLTQQQAPASYQHPGLGAKQASMPMSSRATTSATAGAMPSSASPAFGARGVPGLHGGAAGSSSLFSLAAPAPLPTAASSPTVLCAGARAALDAGSTVCTSHDVACVHALATPALVQSSCAQCGKAPAPKHAATGQPSLSPLSRLQSLTLEVATPMPAPASARLSSSAAAGAAADMADHTPPVTPHNSAAATVVVELPPSQVSLKAAMQQEAEDALARVPTAGAGCTADARRAFMEAWVDAGADTATAAPGVTPELAAADRAIVAWWSSPESWTSTIGSEPSATSSPSGDRVVDAGGVVRVAATGAPVHGGTTMTFVVEIRALPCLASTASTATGVDDLRHIPHTVVTQATPPTPRSPNTSAASPAGAADDVDLFMFQDRGLGSGVAATIICANVGDSTACCLTEPLPKARQLLQARRVGNSPGPGTSDPWLVPRLLFLSEDHSPDSAKEYLRVQTQQHQHQHQQRLIMVYDRRDRPCKHMCPRIFLPDGTKDARLVAQPWAHGLHPTNVRQEPATYAVTPPSVTLDATCIAMTRALGDLYAHQFGLSWVPSVSVTDVPVYCGYSVCVASDGLWDNWSYTDWAVQAIGCMKKHAKNAAAAAAAATAAGGSDGAAVMSDGEASVAGSDGLPPAFVRLLSRFPAAQPDTAQHAGADLFRLTMTRAVASFGAKGYDDASFVLWRGDVHN